MNWTKKESVALDSAIRAFGIIKQLPEESKDRIHDHIALFHMRAFDISEKEEPRGIVI